MQLQFHFRRQKGGPFIDSVFSDLKSGDTVELEGPFGDTTLDDDSRRPLLMLAVGEEFAPIKSLIEHAINLDTGAAVRLFWLADKSTGHYLENHCRSWSEVLDDYRFIPMTIAKAVPDASETNRLMESIGREVTDIAAFDIYIAGPPPFQQQLQALLHVRGAAAERLFLLHRRSLSNKSAKIAG